MPPLEDRSASMLDRLVPLERKVIEEEIAGYYNQVVDEECRAGKIPSDSDFPTVRWHGLQRRFNEVVLGMLSSIMGMLAWVYLSSVFLK